MDGWEAIADALGIFSTADATSARLTTRQLAALRRRGDVVWLARGWWATGDVLRHETDSPWDRRRRLHILRARAAIRAHAGTVTASHHTALIVHGLPAFAADLRQVHVTRLDDGQFRRRPGLTVHERLDAATSIDGVIDVGTAIVGTTRLNGQMAGLIAADAALHRQLLGPEDLVRAAALIVGPGTVNVRTLAELADGRSASPGETRLRRALQLMGYRPVPQFRIVDGAFTAVVDLYLEEHRLAIEFDGFVKYGRLDPFGTLPTAADVVFAEKVREDHVRELGHGFLRVVWRELDDLGALRHRVAGVIERRAA